MKRIHIVGKHFLTLHVILHLIFHIAVVYTLNHILTVISNERCTYAHYTQMRTHSHPHIYTIHIQHTYIGQLNYCCIIKLWKTPGSCHISATNTLRFIQPWPVLCFFQNAERHTRPPNLFPYLSRHPANPTPQTLPPVRPAVTRPPCPYPTTPPPPAHRISSNPSAASPVSRTSSCHQGACPTTPTSSCRMPTTWPDPSTWTWRHLVIREVAICHITVILVWSCGVHFVEMNIVVQ